MPDPSPARGGLRRDLRLISVEGLAFSLMVGVGETYVSAFVLALGLGEVASGLVATLPLLAGGAIQLVTPLAVRRLGSRRRWSVLCAGVQAASFAPLVAAAVSGASPAWIIFGAVTLYWAAGMAVSPAWNAWIDGLVPRPIRRAYFARRTSLTQAGIVFGLVGGGVVLQTAAGRGAPLAGFAAIFIVAAITRLASARILAAQSERPPAGDRPLRGDSFARALRRTPTGPAARLLAYLLGLTAAVTIASPFFSAYMLAELRLPYAEYMTLVGASVLAKVVILPLLSGLARRFGLVGMLRVAWVGIAAVPALWLVSDSYGYLLALQIVSGVFWAAHEYSTFLLLFETVHAERRVTILTLYNLGTAVATVGGSLLGAWLFDSRGGGAHGYFGIFAVSTGLRTAAGLALARIAAVRGPERPASFRAVAVRPAIGLVLRPILATIRRKVRPESDGSDQRFGRGG